MSTQEELRLMMMKMMTSLGVTTGVVTIRIFLFVTFCTMMTTTTTTTTTTSSCGVLVSAFSSSPTTPSIYTPIIKWQQQQQQQSLQNKIVRRTTTTMTTTMTNTMAKTKTASSTTTRLASSSLSASATDTIIAKRINGIENDTVSTPIALLEERMLAVGIGGGEGEETTQTQTLLEELDEVTRKKISKQLEKLEKQKVRLARNNNNNKSKNNGGFGGGGSGGGGGFGGSKGKKKGTVNNKKGKDDDQNDEDDKSSQQHHDVFDIKHDTSNFGAVIVDQGVARINNCLTEKTSSELINYINDFLADALHTQSKKNPVEDLSLEEIYAQQPKFADVREKLNRWDMLLPLETYPSNEVCNALYEILLSTNNGCISTTIESILGKEAQLYELGTLISDPNSERQLLHADYNYAPDFQPNIPPALTCFVALQDITETMGPTTFILNSSTEEYHNEINTGQYTMYSSDGDNESTIDETTETTTIGKSILLETSTNKLSTLQNGDCSLYNPMTLHCGNANRSNSRRIIFYFSFKNPKFNEKDWPLAYASLRPDLRTRNLSLSQIKTILVSEHDKKEEEESNIKSKI